MISPSMVSLTGVFLMGDAVVGWTQDDHEIVKAHAPMYWFAIDEPIYPTLPHPFAFDGVALKTGTSPCRLEIDPKGQADFRNPTELKLDQTCDRVALKRRFRPLIQGSSQGAEGEDPAPRPRMRILYDGPTYFSGGIDITDSANAVCRGQEGAQELRNRLRTEFRMPFQGDEPKGDEPKGLDSAAKSFAGLKTSNAETSLCEGELTESMLGLTPVKDAKGKVKKGLRFRVKVAWDDTCRGVPVTARPDRECRGSGRLMLFGGNKTLDDEGSGVTGPKRILPPRYLIQYWGYFSYDRGINGHRHDGEHVFVFLEGDHKDPLTSSAPVVALVGGGHEEDSANNILIAGSPQTHRAVVDAINFPERLPAHPMVLVELGKHASAIDRTLDGRFDLGIDANLWGENAWGSRDTQSALLGKAQLGKMSSWYSLPRSHDVVFTEASAWQTDGTAQLTAGYALGYPSAAFKEFARQISKGTTPSHGDCDFGGSRTYRLMPISTLRDLSKTIGGAAKDGGWSAVRTFLDEHDDKFWEQHCQPALPAVGDPEVPAIMQALRGWLDTETEKRDVWRHRKFVDPDAVFKTHLFPRWTLGWSRRGFSGSAQHFLTLQVADLGKQRYLHDSTLEFALQIRSPSSGAIRPRSHFALTVENFRGRHRGWYVGGSTEAEMGAHRRWDFRAGYAQQFATLETIPGIGSLLSKASVLSPIFKRTRLTLRAGGRGLLAGGQPLIDTQPRAEVRRAFAFEWGLSLNFVARSSKHPLKFFADLGRDRRSEASR